MKNLPFFAAISILATAALAQTGGQPVQQPQSSTGGGQAPASSIVAQTLHVYAYPNKHQTQELQYKDENECYQSAQAQAGPNSSGGQQQGQQASNAGKGSTAKGAAGGAAGGAAIGAIAGNAGEGAAIGAVGGTVIGHHKKKKAQEQAKEQQQTQQNQAQDNVKRAYSACMESRSYTVK